MSKTQQLVTWTDPTFISFYYRPPLNEVPIDKIVPLSVTNSKNKNKNNSSNYLLGLVDCWPPTNVYEF